MFPSSHRSSPLKLNIQSKKKNFLTVSLSVLQRFFLDASAALFESAVGLFREGSEGRGGEERWRTCTRAVCMVDGHV